MEKEKKNYQKNISQYLSNLIVSHNLQLLQKEKNVHTKNTEQSCIKFKKFNSSSVHGIELTGQFKFSSLDKN